MALFLLCTYRGLSGHVTVTEQFCRVVKRLKKIAKQGSYVCAVVYTNKESIGDLMASPY